MPFYEILNISYSSFYNHYCIGQIPHYTSLILLFSADTNAVFLFRQAIRFASVFAGSSASSRPPPPFSPLFHNLRHVEVRLSSVYAAEFLSSPRFPRGFCRNLGNSALPVLASSQTGSVIVCAAGATVGAIGPVKEKLTPGIAR